MRLHKAKYKNNSEFNRNLGFYYRKIQQDENSTLENKFYYRY